MPIDYSKYPANWKAISASIRERAGHRCEQCGVANYAVGARDDRGVWHDMDDIDNMNSDHGNALWEDGYPKIIRIVLTTAHLDHDTANNDPANLKALCQKCHLTHDAKHHAANAKVTRARKRERARAERGERTLL